MSRKLLIAILALWAVQLSAVETGKPDLDRLQTLLGGATLDSVNATAVPGLYEVIIGSQILYLSEDGQFAISGDIVDLSTRNNLTETRRGQLRVAAINNVGEENMVVFEPSGATKHTVTIFTDIDCGYCRQLHREIAAYNQEGIKIRYLMFPRAGIGSESYDKAVTVWCSADRKDALTRSKMGEILAAKSCANPVKDHYELGQMLGVRGTPSIVLENGEMVPGYVPATQLAQMLENGRPVN